nr:carboxymuconolactone decarboxylase family protein [Anaerolineae bacterium]
MKTQFNKRIYTTQSFTASINNAFAHLDELKAASRGGRVSRAFTERIMLAVTQVNGCRYCDYGHTRAALAAGVTGEEIAAIRQGELAGVPEEEITALVFAQHFAETEGHPENEAWERLVSTYGHDTARDIMAYIRMIMVGNLWGNTFDALLSRLVGRPAAGSTLGNELGVLLGGFIIVPGALIRRAFRKKPDMTPFAGK